MLKENGYIDGKLMALDGTKIRANNSKKHNYTLKRVEARIKEIDDKITEYLTELENNDSLENKIDELRQNKQKYEDLRCRMKEDGVGEISTTDKEARLMKANNGGADVSYNVQSVVDSRHKLIAGMEVESTSADNGLLGKVMPKVKKDLGLEEITVVADTGYYNTEDFKVCEDNKIYPIVSKKKELPRELYKKEDFRYDEEHDLYICPNGKKLVYKGIDQKVYRRYMNQNECRQCPMKSYCTQGNYREVKRHIYLEYAERHDIRLKENPNFSCKNKEDVELIVAMDNEETD